MNTSWNFSPTSGTAACTTKSSRAHLLLPRRDRMPRFQRIFAFAAAMGSASLLGANVVITAPTLSITYCNFNSTYLPLGNIVITEGAVNDIGLPLASTNYTITISPPANYLFLAGTGSVTNPLSGDINVAATITVAASLVTITYQSTRGTRNTRSDSFTISGLYVSATGSAGGNIIRAGGTGAVAGLVVNTVVGTLTTNQVCPSTPPGGYSTGLRAWYPATGSVYDASGAPCTNGTAVATWNEASNGFHMAQGVAGQRPSWYDGSGSTFCNYNPSIRFGNHYLANTYGLLTNGTTYNKLNIYAVYYDNAAGDFDWLFTAGGANGLNRVSLSMNWAGAAVFDCDVPATYNRVSPNTTTQLPAARTNLVAVKADNSGIYNGGEATKVQAFCNGAAGPSSTSYTSITMNNSIAQVGDNELVTTDGTNYPFTGDLMELVIYTGGLSQAVHQRIESYLALKYSVTLSGHDYFNTAGTNIFALGGGYVNGIIGVIRDDSQGLYQKQSRQQDDSTRIYIGTLASTNAANTSTFSGDLQSLVIGHNGGQMRALSATASERPGGVGIYSRLNREWKLTNTAFNGTFSLCFTPKTSPITAADLRLLVDDDGDFTNATMYGTSSGLTFGYSGGVVTVGGITTALVPTNGTRYLTLASVASTTPLPVELLYFTALPADPDGVGLYWSTATELDNDHFEVERSRGGAVFESIGAVPGQGTTQDQQEYAFFDHQPYEGINYYRLKQVDADGDHTYSEVRSITIGESAPLVVYPNPAQDFVQIAGLDPGSGHIPTLHDEAGREIPLASSAFNNGRVDVRGLPPGSYIVRVGGQTARIIRQ